MNGQNLQAGLIKPTKKPDCGNIIKIICDALNGIAYRDDPRTDVRMWKI